MSYGTVTAQKCSRPTPEDQYYIAPPSFKTDFDPGAQAGFLFCFTQLLTYLLAY